MHSVPFYYVCVIFKDDINKLSNELDKHNLPLPDRLTFNADNYDKIPEYPYDKEVGHNCKNTDSSTMILPLVFDCRKVLTLDGQVKIIIRILSV